MNILDSYTYSVLEELIKQKVEFIVIGGYAVNFHGFRRPTGDIDLLIKPDNGENKTRLIAALRNLGITEPVLEQLNKLDFEKAQAFRDGEEPFRIDFLTKVSGVKFNEAWIEKQSIEVDGLNINFLHIKHLIATKITTGRTKDAADIEELQRIQKYKK
ncbi:MAG TPA: nucleotidyltransferase [Bacteroidia bacterium]|jgi:predicted nucleotidyltransferase|nr:nucleotidyltransferase [Bacteroidia bacterium]